MEFKLDTENINPDITQNPEQINHINYEKKGTGDTFVFFLHGWGAELSLYRKIFEVVANSPKYTAVALDFPGFGGTPEPTEPNTFEDFCLNLGENTENSSENPTQNDKNASQTSENPENNPKSPQLSVKMPADGVWGVPEYAQFTLEFIRAFNPKKVVLFGHSFGGRVIIKLFDILAQNPDKKTFKVEKIVLIDSAGIKPKKTTKAKIRQRLFKIAKHIFPKSIVAKMRKKMSSADFNAASEHMKKVLVKTVNLDLAELLPKISASTLLVWGENDTATPLADGKLMEEKIPDAGLVTIPNCGHYSFLENYPMFERVVKSYLKID
jgi:pimeloyl-ACP methyl ester carboxylesterase